MNDSLLDPMRDARRFTLALVEDLPDDRLSVARLDTVNPFLWELGHVAFFHDSFIRGYLDGSPPLIAEGERIYDSFRVEHDDRWALPLPSRSATLAYMRSVEQSVEERLAGREATAADTYCYQLATLHEDMHGEAFFYMRQTLGFPAPEFSAGAEHRPGTWPGDAEVPGGTFHLGADPDDHTFIFDNEKWAHPIEVAPFRIARAPVTNGEFREFVDDGSYTRKDLWSHHGWVWRCKNEITAPEYWSGGPDWHRRSYDRDVPLAPHEPVVHVSYYEAEAYCKWAGRRLPSEAEWEMAASFDPETRRKRRFPWGDDPPTHTTANLDGATPGCTDVAAHAAGDSAVGCRQMAGNVWEWTACAFYPFPGFVVDLPYREYSAPWFGDRQVLKGGAFATRSRLAYNTYRNFFQLDRRDIFAGFRTCAS